MTATLEHILRQAQDEVRVDRIGTDFLALAPHKRTRAKVSSMREQTFEPHPEEGLQARLEG